MAFEIKTSLRLSQSLVMTPQLQQAIKLLQLNRMELMEVVNQELVDNPILEEVQETIESGEQNSEHEADGSLDPEAQQTRDEEGFSQATAEQAGLKDENAPTTSEPQDEFNWESYLEEFQGQPPSTPSMKESPEDLPSFESALTKTTSLEEHLIWQLSMLTLSESEQILGEVIIGNLNEDGYLLTPLADLALESGVELEDAEEILKIIHTFDPIGVAARDLKECLLIQAKFLTPRQPLLEKVIEEHLPDLEKRAYSNIEKSLSISREQVTQVVHAIQEFEPKPGRSFQSIDSTNYITPDIYVYKVGEEYVISLNEDGLPKLRISPYYRNVLQNSKAVQGTEVNLAATKKQTKEYVQEKLRSAIWLIRSIHNRQKTIYKVTEAIVKRQKEFFDKGVQALKPLILKDVANDIGMHESTISRVTTNKFVHTPVGIFELKYFFNSSINASDGSDSLASEAVKEKIKKLVAKENPKNPLSDQKLVELLKADNIDIARRTVAKYRDMLNILSSSKRKQTL